MMRRNADRLLRLVNQLLDLSKVQVGMLQVQKRTIEISRFLQHLAQSFVPLANSKNIAYQINIPERDYIIELDPDKLEKIVYNLLSNAFKFTPEGGQVAIHLLITQRKTLRLSVSDTGIGIAEDIRDKIFDRFYQVDIELTKALRSEDTTSHIPILLLTARDDVETKIKGFASGAEQYLLKSFEWKELVARVRGLLEQRRLLQEKFGKAVVLEPKAVTLTHRDASLLENLVGIIEDNMETETFSVDQLQKEIGMSRMQLHPKLKALTNQSASEFIRSIKLKRAAQLLQQGG